MGVLFWIGLGGATGSALCTAFVWSMRKLSRSRLVIRRFVNPAYHEIRCPHCTLGTQYLHHETGWGPIPKSVRMITGDSVIKRAGQANCRRCHSCGGNGYASTRVRADVLPDFGVREVNW